MPLDKTCSVDAYKDNIRTEIRAGKSPAQATAIARRTVEEACKEEGKPVPTAIAKAKSKKPKSREYLESALDECRRLLPGWMFAVIHQAAFPKSGGNAARNRRMSAAEKAWVEKAGVGSMSLPELKTMLHTLNVTFAAYTRQGKKTDSVVARAKSVVAEMKKRGAAAEGKVVAAISKEETPTHLPKGTKIEKGFINGEPEGGMHAHGLDRRNGQTLDDGPHLHLFVIPGSGEVLVTLEDGVHAHIIDDGGNTTDVDGTHTHSIPMPDGSFMETKISGAHSHELMVETSGFDGLHRHILRLADGTQIDSLSPGEFVGRFLNMEFFHPQPIWSSCEIANAMNEARLLRDQQFGAEPDAPFSVDEAVEMLAKGEKPPDPPMTMWEVMKLANGAAYCQLSDVDDQMLMKNPGKVTIDVGDIVEVTEDGVIAKHSESSEPHSFEEAKTISLHAEELAKATKMVDFCGPQDSVLVFVSASPSPLELARKEALIGPDGALFQERYLAPMGLTKSDIATGFAIPVNCDPTDVDVEPWRDRLAKSLAVYNRAKVVALGRVAKKALGPIASFSLPHPAAVRRHGDSGEVDRKIRSICKSLDITQAGTETRSSSTEDPIHGDSGATLADSISELGKGGSLRVAVTKSTAEKQIVYGVILDPYQVDLHNDWIPPAEIETTAHDFLEKSRVVGLKHNGVADAEVVESWVEIYPTEKDRELALQNLPHKVLRRQFGTDTIHSGAWVAGVKLSDALWETHKKGELDAFSIGGFSFKTQISTDAMPEVEFVDLVPNP